MTEWIKCSEKLPEKNQSVLVCAIYKITPECADSFDMYIAWIKDFGKENKPIWQYSWCCGCFCPEKITHWKELPEPPHDN